MDPREKLFLDSEWDWIYIDYMDFVYQVQGYIGIAQAAWGTITFILSLTMFILNFIPAVKSRLNRDNYKIYRIIMIVQAVLFAVQTLLPAVKYGIYNLWLDIDTESFDYDMTADIVKTILYIGETTIFSILAQAA